MKTTPYTFRTLGTLAIALTTLAAPAAVKADTASVHAEITEEVG